MLARWCVLSPAPLLVLASRGLRSGYEAFFASRFSEKVFQKSLDNFVKDMYIATVRLFRQFLLMKQLVHHAADRERGKSAKLVFALRRH